MSLEIVGVDPADETTYRAWFDVRAVAEAVDHPEAGPFVASYADARAEHLNGGSEVEILPFLLLQGEEIVGRSLVTMGRHENSDRAEIHVCVPVGRRRAGLGSRLLDHAMSVAQQAGRRVAHGWSAATVGQPDVGQMFGVRHGFAVAVTTAHRRLDLPVAESALAALEKPVGADGYRIELWQAIPDARLGAYCRLYEAISRDVPMGTAELEPETWTPDRLRAVIARREAQGRLSLTAAVFASGGEIVGNSELVIKQGSNGHVAQANTLVLRAHRGHGLGMALKVANLRELARLHPDSVAVHTSNENTNEPVIALNERLGFRVVETEVMLQRFL